MMDVEHGICHQTAQEGKHGFAITSKLLTAVSILISTVALVGVLIVVLQYQELQSEMQEHHSTKTLTERSYHDNMQVKAYAYKMCDSVVQLYSLGLHRMEYVCLPACPVMPGGCQL